MEFLKSLWGLGTEEEGGYHTGPPGYIDWRNSFLEIDSGAPSTFKNMGSARSCTTINISVKPIGTPACPIKSLFCSSYRSSCSSFNIQYQSPNSKKSIPPRWESIPGLRKRYTNSGLARSFSSFAFTANTITVSWHSEHAQFLFPKISVLYP